MKTPNENYQFLIEFRTLLNSITWTYKIGDTVGTKTKPFCKVVVYKITPCYVHFIVQTDDAWILHRRKKPKYLLLISRG